MAFHDDFLWGAATASYQIEGGAYEDGRGLSVWDTFCREPGRVFEGHTGDVACDHYHRWREDIALMKDMGLKGYRFSVSWTRLLPEGTGAVNSKGVDFYNKLIDGLLDADIQPYLTLFHWDYPQALFNRGGWLNPDSSDWFLRYAELIGKNFGDRVHDYMTLNEPQIFIGHGYQSIEHAPGVRLSRPDILRMTKNVLLGHGKAVPALRGASPGCRVGVALAGDLFVPATTSPDDVASAKKAVFELRPDTFVWSVGWWADAMILGRLPEGTEAAFGREMPDITAEDLKTMSPSLDFFGQNMYFADVVKADGKGGYEKVSPPVGHRKTAIGWTVTPEIAYWIPRFLYERYKLPIYITENGISCADGPSADGVVRDPARIDYLNDHLYNLSRSIDDGADVRGYFQWSLLDNFEWAKGYDDRFGLIYVDYQTLKRIPKESAAWYAEVIRTNGANLKTGN